MSRSFPAPAAALLALASCGAPPDVGARALAVRDGVPSDDTAVVALVASPVPCGRTPAILCTGTLIAPNAVLTAAHCLEGRPAYSMAVADGASLGTAARVHAVTRLVQHPSYDPQSHLHDVGLVLLEVPITDLAPRALATEPLPSSRAGSTLRIAGYGQPGEGALDGVRREGTSIVESVDSLSFRTRPGPALSCSGDSGGPVLGMQSGAEAIVGVTSSGDPPCVAYADNAQVASHVLDFIRPTLERTGAASPRTPALPGAALCEMECDDDGSCPLGMHCGRTMDGARRCALGASEPGSFGDPCAQANATCLRVPGLPACRTYAICAGATPPVPGAPPATDGPSPPVPRSGGCGARPDAPTPRGIVLLALLALFRGALRAGRRRRAPACARRARSPRARAGCEGGAPRRCHRSDRTPRCADRGV